MRSLTLTIRSLPSALLGGCTFGLAMLGDSGQPPLGDADTDADSDSDSDSDSDTDSDTDSDVEVTVDSITPAYGTTSGGTDVLITGTFDEDVSVRIDGVVAEILSVSPRKGELHISTPAGADEGPAAVVVSSGSSTATVDDGFYYYRDGDGQIGLIGSLTFVNIVGDYWSGNPQDQGYAWFWLNEPVDFEWGEVYASSLDQCASGYSYGGSATLYDVGRGSTATLSSGAKQIPFTWSDSEGMFNADTLAANEVAIGADYNLEVVPSESVPAFEMPDVATMPASFTVTAPQITTDRIAQVSRGFSLAWSGGSTADGVLVELDVMSSDGGTIEETVTCWLRDDGAFNVPSNAFRSWPTGRQLNIFVSRYSAGTGTVPYNNAGSGMIGEYTVYGAAFTK